MNARLKKDWVLTEDAFERVLNALDPDREAAGEKYELMRLKLVKYFEWRGLTLSEDLADAAINRLARKLAENGQIENLNAFLLGIARHVASEERRRQDRLQKAADELARREDPSGPNTDIDARAEKCSLCLAELPEQDRALILRYFSFGKSVKIEDHKRMAEELGISLNSMRIRVHRIKLKLERCIRDREGEAQGG